MLKSLYSAISGIQANQVRMDVIGNNIANVNTTGFKRGSVAFQELLSQTISGASAPEGSKGGINAEQVGLGVKVGSISNQFTQGTTQYTGSNSDMAVEGNGFFVVAAGQSTLYTRAGNFALDKDGNLVQSGNGMILQGWMADGAGVVNTNNQLTNIQVPIGKTIPAKATSTINYAQNLDARTNGSVAYQPSPMTVTDGVSGEKAQVTIALTPTGVINEWTYAITALGVDGSTVSGLTNAAGTLKLDNAGRIISSSGGTASVAFAGGATIDIAPPAAGAASGGNFAVASAGDTDSACMSGVFTAAAGFVSSMQIYDPLGGTHNVNVTLSKLGDNQWGWTSSSSEPGITATGSGTLTYDPSSGKLVTSTGGPMHVDFGSGTGSSDVALNFSSSTQYAADSSLLATSQDGYSSGSLQSFSVDGTGAINGTFSNGVIRKMATVALANFSNVAGLVKEAGSFYSESRNSGEAYVGTSGTGGRGNLPAGSLETSNVDLSQEFTDMITTQRGYQANAKVITTSDELLQELLNLKR